MQFYAIFTCVFIALWKLTINDDRKMDLEVMLHAQISSFKKRNFIECSWASVASKKIFEETRQTRPYNANIWLRNGGGICRYARLTKICGTRPLRGRGCPPPHWGWGLKRGPPPQKKNEFLYQNGEFWCILGSNYLPFSCLFYLNRNRPTCRTEIYWRPFRHFGNYNDSVRKSFWEKMTKIGQKLIKIAQNCVVFFVHFPYLLS